MKPNTIPAIIQIVNEAVTPVIILVVADACNEFKLRIQDEVEQAVLKHNKPVAVFTLCLPEESIVFPRPITPILYYYLPKNQTPIFWRTGNLTGSVPTDLDVAHKMFEGMSEIEARYTPEHAEAIYKTERDLENEKKVQFPPKFQQVRNFAKEMWVVAKRGVGNLPILTSAEEGKRRLDICEGCEKFDAASNRCASCGCNMSLKTQIMSSKCPLEKW